MCVEGYEGCGEYVLMRKASLVIISSISTRSVLEQDNEEED